MPATPSCPTTCATPSLNLQRRTCLGVVLNAALLAACGGGGGGESPPPPPSSPLTKAWQTAQLIETNNAGDAVEVQVAVAANGDAIAVWSQSDGLRNNIRANRYTAATGAWAEAELIEAIDTGNAGSPQVAINASGQAIVVWTQFTAPGAEIRANHFDGTRWGTSSELVADAGTTGKPVSNSRPQIALDAKGNAIAVWERKVFNPNPMTSSRIDIGANRYVVATGQWDGIELIENDDLGDAQFPHIGIDAAGNALAVWQQVTGTPSALQNSMKANRFVVGQGWQGAELIESSNAFVSTSSSPQIAVNAAGNAVAVWVQFGGINNSVWANRYTVGQGWGTAELIETINTGFARDPAVAIDSSGKAIAVWCLETTVFANRFDGTRWGIAEALEADAVGGSNTPQIAMDSSGNGVAVWSRSNGAEKDSDQRAVILSRRCVAGVWSPAERLDVGTTSQAFAPQIALDANGNAVAVWGQFNIPPGAGAGRRSDIFANVLR
jgi:hypothetical protein